MPQPPVVQRKVESPPTELQDAFQQAPQLVVHLALMMADESVWVPEVSLLVRATQPAL